MTFPFAQVSPIEAPAPSGVAYIGGHQGAYAGGVEQWTSAPVALGASDLIVIVEYRESNAASSTTTMTVGGVGLTHWAGGIVGVGLINTCYIDMWYGKPGAMASANIISSSAAGIGSNKYAWRFGATTLVTPKDLVTATQIVSNAQTLNDIDRVTSGGIVAACAATFGATTFTATWTGAEIPVIDFQGVSATGNNYLCVAHLDSLSAISTDDLTFHISASHNISCAALSFGP